MPRKKIVLLLRGMAQAPALLLGFRGSPQTTPLQHEPNRIKWIRRAAMILGLGCIPLSSWAQSPNVEVRDLRLSGVLVDQGVEFTATGKVTIDGRKGAIVSLLAGDVALMEVPEIKSGELEYDNGEYRLHWERSGRYEFSVRFLAKVSEVADVRSVVFKFLTAPIRSLELIGFPQESDLTVENASLPVREGDRWIAFLSPESTVAFDWRPAKSDSERELFYSSDITSVSAVAAGMIKQNQKIELQVMQGEMDSVEFEIVGPGEISQIDGQDILGWKVERGENGSRRLTIRFARPQTKRVVLLAKSQIALPRLPAETELLRLEPIGATRVSGQILLLNDGAVNLGIKDMRNVSQVSPGQIGLDATERAQLRLEERQAFGFVYAGNHHTLTIRAEDILPEVSVSTVALIHLGINETTINVEMNLDIREAPLREFAIELPDGYSIVGIAQNALSDYTVTKGEGQGQRLKLIFGAPISGRQMLTLELEKNGPPLKGTLRLPRVTPLDVKSSRGYVGLSADDGLKVSTLRQEGLSEMIVSYFPVKNERLQIAFRMRNADWTADIEVEYRESSIQAESFHLFSIGDGVAYGSSIITYEISGAPVQELIVAFPENYENVELSGANIRDWREVDDGYVIRLHSPVSGTYSLLATFETRLNDQAEAISFSGAEPRGLQSERGYVVFVSPNQVEIDPDPIAPPLLKLEAQELPPEYLIMLDAPIVASYHYASRPFELVARVDALDRESSIDQVVELANIVTNISKTGEVLTVAEYVLKSKNASFFAIILPEGARLWKVTVNDQEPIPARDGDRILIPLPDSYGDVSSHISVKYSLQKPSGEVALLETPKVEAPILLTDWRLSSGRDRALEYVSGTVRPEGVPARPMPFELLHGISQTSPNHRNLSGESLRLISIAAIALLLGWMAFRPSASSKPWWLAPFGIGVAMVGIGLSVSLALNFWPAPPVGQTSSLRLTDTVLAPMSSLSVELLNVEAALAPVDSQSNLGMGLGVLALSPLIAWLVRRWTRRSRSPFISLALHGVASALLLALDQGLALLVLFGASIVFVPLLLETGRFLAARLKVALAFKRGDSASSALLLLFVFCDFPQRLEADSSSDILKGTSFLREEPVQVKAWVNDAFAKVDVEFNWDAKSGERLPVLFTPAVITSLDIPEGSVKLIQDLLEGRLVYFLEAERSGNHSIAFAYQTPVDDEGGVWIFRLQSIPSLIYEATIDFERSSCEAFSVSSVGIDYQDSSPDGHTVARMRLKPEWELPIGCRPRSRDTSLEETVFYVETINHYLPHAGTIEGEHLATLRIAQGQLRELSVAVPEGMTITDARADWLDTWQYDPAGHRLVAVARTPLTGHSVLWFRSQMSAEALPYSARIRVVRFPDASNETGWLGISMSDDIQLDQVNVPANLAAISIGDFPAIPSESDRPESADRELRRAFRYSDNSVVLEIGLSKVEPEIRVVSEELTSLGEDRVTHTAKLTTRITRAGVFQLQLQLPEDMAIESISGKEVSHWTESVENGYRIATLHLIGRTLGETTQYVTLTGPGVQRDPNWEPPRVRVVGASKQRGRLVLAPELGLRVDTLQRVGVSQLDPIEANIQDRSKLAFRLLENDWKLTLEIQLVDPWVECRLLQDVTQKEGLSETNATFRYSIENAGVKQFRIKLPIDAIGVRFKGEHLANFQRSENDEGVWEVNLDRRVVGDYRLQLEFQELRVGDSLEMNIVGIRSLDTQLQESFLGVRAKQRLNLHPVSLSDLLVPIEWQQIPQLLRLESREPSDLAYRTVQSEFDLKLRLERLDMAEILPAEVKSVRLHSLLSETGICLTQAVFDIDPGHKPDLHVRLPEGAEFWSCYVNDQSVWPAVREGTLLIPLKRASNSKETSEVRVSYLLDTSGISESGSLSFIGPQCDLPLENIDWRIFIPNSIEGADWEGTLDYDSNVGLSVESFELEAFLSRDSNALTEQKRKAEELLELGNTFADGGDPQAARRALESAYALSKFDLDFNEDARVQLNNLKVQQTMVGLTSWRNHAFSNEVGGGESLTISRENDQLRFSRLEADQLLTYNSAEENRALSELARRFIEHQNAVLRDPSALRSLFPKHGMGHRFSRRLQTEPWSEMRMDLSVSSETTSRFSIWALLLAGSLAMASLSHWCYARREGANGRLIS